MSQLEDTSMSKSEPKLSEFNVDLTNKTFIFADN